MAATQKKNLSEKTPGRRTKERRPNVPEQKTAALFIRMSSF